MTAHTPGPWTVQKGFLTIYAYTRGWGTNAVAATCYEGRDGGSCVDAEEARANAQLIAAAPDLLEALERAHAHFQQLGHDAVCNGVHAPDGQCEGSHWASETEDVLEAAIAKAKGVSQ